MSAPERIADYRIERELARGGMGVIYVAREPGTEREVALKLLLTERSESARARQRFEVEAQTVARLRHPNIVAIHKVGLHQGAPYLVMDLVDGESLEERVERAGALEHRDAARVIEQLASAVEHAHGKEVLHRDIKPANVLLSRDGRPLLTDFGLARDLSDEKERLTRTGQLLGTPIYMPPEQARGEHARLDARADVYSLGMTLFYALTADVPFSDETLFGLLTRVNEETPPAPSEFNSEVPPGLDAIVLKCLAKEPEARYATAGALSSDLARWSRDEPITASTRSGMGRRARLWFVRRKRSPYAWILGGVAAVLLAALVIDRAYVAPRAAARAQLADELAWQERVLHPALYGLRPGFAHRVEGGELNRRLTELDGVERRIGASAELSELRARLRAELRLVRRERRRSKRAHTALPQIVVDALEAAEHEDLTAAVRLLEDAAREFPDRAEEVARVRLALLARHDARAFFREAKRDDELARELLPLVAAFCYGSLLGPAADSASMVAQLRQLQERAQSLGGTNELLLTARRDALEAHAASWGRLPVGPLLLDHVQRLDELLRRDPLSVPQPLQLPQLQEALEEAFQRTLASWKRSPPVVSLACALELERVLRRFSTERLPTQKLRRALRALFRQKQLVTGDGREHAACVSGFVRVGLPEVDLVNLGSRLRLDSTLSKHERGGWDPAFAFALMSSRFGVDLSYGSAARLAARPEVIEQVYPGYLAEVHLFLATLEGANPQTHLDAMRALDLDLASERFRVDLRYALAKGSVPDSLHDDAVAYAKRYAAGARSLVLRRVCDRWLVLLSQKLPPERRREVLDLLSR